MNSKEKNGDKFQSQKKRENQYEAIPIILCGYDSQA